MPTTRPATATDAEPKVASATASVKAARGSVLGASRKLSLAYLDGVQHGVSRLTKLERAAAEKSRLDAAGSLLNAHATLTDKVTSASVTAVRHLIAV